MTPPPPHIPRPAEEARSVARSSEPAPQRAWLVQVYGFAPHVRLAPTKGAARYADWRAAQEAGYFYGDFHRYLINCAVREATEYERTAEVLL